MPKANINTEEALQTVKSIAEGVAEIADKTTAYKQKVTEAYEATNMPMVSQVSGLVEKMKEILAKTTEEMAQILDITRKYADDVDEVANNDGGIGNLIL